MSNIFLKYHLIIIITLAFWGNLKSQAIFDTLLLNELEIISNLDDINSTIKSITIDTIARKETNLHDIGELLANFTPVFVKSYGKGSISTVSFRGTGASHTKVLWEGFNINSPMLGQSDFSLLPGSFFDEIELLYGGGSLSSVSGALGGSVSLKSNSPNPDNNLLSFQQSIGSFNTYMTSATLNLNSSGFGSSTRFIRQSSSNNFQYYNNAILPSSQEMTQTNADFSNYGFIQQFSYRISDKQKITILSWNQWNNRNIPTIMTNIEKGGSQQEWQNDFFSRNIIGWALNNPSTTWEAKAAYFYEDLNYYLETSDSLESNISLIDSHNKAENFSVKGNVSSQCLYGIMLNAGIEFLFQEVKSNNYSDRKTRSLTNSFISLKKNFKDILSVEALLRSEIMDNEFVPLMPMLGVNIKPVNGRNFHIRLNASRNYNLPSLNDLYWYPSGNEELLPEKSYESELGVDYTTNIKYSQIITISGSVYASTVRNWIIWLPGDYRYWSPQNIASIFTRGSELSVRISGSFNKFEYKIFTEYAYTRTTDNSDESKANGQSDIQLMYVPEHNANGYINLKTNGYYLNWGISYISSRSTSLNKKDKYAGGLPQYVLNNVSLGKNINITKADFELKFKIYNIFNVDYQTVLWRAMPGRNFELSISCNVK